MSFKTFQVPPLLYKVTIIIHPDHAMACYFAILISFYALFILLLTLSNLIVTPTWEKKKSYYCQSQVKLKCFTILQGPVRFFVCFICAQCIISRVFYACTLCVSHTINPAHITDVHCIDFWSFPEREREKEAKRNREKNERHESSLTVSFLARLLNFI